ncbi:MAG: hypothetical protein JNJ83_04975 [Verrucomicrobiaceae bacterium]|nr:hypothetical protein [Verrucomicrobiaceae bacterium]
MAPTSKLESVMAEKTDAQLLDMFPNANDWTPQALDVAREELSKRGLPIPAVKLPPQPTRPNGKAAGRYAAATGRVCGILAFLWAISGFNPDAGNLLRWQFNLLLGVGAFAISMLAYLLGSLVDGAQGSDASLLPSETEMPFNNQEVSGPEEVHSVTRDELRWYHVLVAIVLPYVGIPWGIIHLIKERRRSGMSMILISGIWLAIIAAIIIVAEYYGR